MEKSKTDCIAKLLASSIITMALVIAPGPQIIGIARGVMDISFAYDLTSESFIFTFPSLACNISIPIKKNMTPPTILKLLTEIPKKLISSCPDRAKKMIIIKAIKEAFLATFVRSSFCKSEVMVIKIGITPSGFINVKNEVNPKSPNVIISFKNFSPVYIFDVLYNVCP